MEDCVFCKVLKGELPSTKFYEDDDFVVIENIHPVVKGHMLVVLKRHVETFMYMDEKFYGKVLVVAKKVCLERGFKDFNLIVNNGEIAGQEILHFHLHILPRVERDGFGLGV